MDNKIIKIERDRFIDSLKGIAILGIIAVHSGLGHQPEPLASLGKFGANSVQLFFIISAFLGCESLARHPITNFRGYCKWLLRKVLRIAPLYYIALSFALLETAGNGNPYWSGGALSFYNILSHILFLNGLHPFWINSIMSVEWYIADLMILYFVLPVIMKFVNTFDRAGVLVVLSICFAFLFNHSIDRIWGISENEVVRTFIYNFSFINQFQVMAFGILLFYGMRYVKYIGKGNGYFVLLMGVYFLIGVMFNRTLKVTSIYGYLAIGFALFFIGVKESKCKFIDNKLFSLIGKYSFGIYLFHYTLIDYMYLRGWLTNGCSLSEYIFKFLLILLFSFAIAYVCQNGLILFKNLMGNRGHYESE